MLSFFQNNPNTSVFNYSKHSLFSLDNNSFKDQQTSTNFNEIPFSSTHFPVHLIIYSHKQAFVTFLSNNQNG